MVKNTNCLILLTIFLIFAFNVSGQERIITESEFKEILAGGEQNLKGKIYRLTKTEEVFSDRNVDSESVKIRVNEFVAPNKWREVEELKSPTKNIKTERLWDGKNLYVRENDGEWKKYRGGASGGGSIKTGRITTSYKFVERTVLNNQNVNVYEIETNRKATKFTQTSMFEVHYIERTKYWINEDGFFLKKLLESEIVGSKSLVRASWIYEYDLNITIEAPIN